MKIPRGFFALWGLLTFLWFAANSSFSPSAFVTGTLISAVLAYVFTRTPGVWQDVRFTPKRLSSFLLYTAIFLIELVRANLNMMRYVYSPRIKIKPGIVRIRTNLKTPVGRLALANSIALTPGSLVVDIDGDSLYIHWLDVKTTDPDEATRAIAGAFEEPLEKTLAENILFIAAALIFLGVAFGALRLVLGHTVVDRVAAVDMLGVVSLSLIALYAHVAERSIYLDVALVYGVLSFLAVVAIARYLERGL